MKKLLLKTMLLLCALVAGMSSAWADQASFAPSNFSGQGTTGSGSAITATVDGVTFACDKGYGTTQIRCYSGGKITISSSKTITAISFTFSGSYNGGLKTSYTELSTTSWEQTLSSQARITACTVTYSTGGGSTTPSISANDVKIAYDATSGEIAYTIANPTEATLTAARTVGDWISNVAVDAEHNKVTFDATANAGNTDRTATITLSYTGASDKVVTVTQAHYVAAYATLPFAFDGGKADIENTDGLTQDGLDSDYGSSPKLKFNGTGDCVILQINERPGTLTFDIKGNSFSGGTFKVQTSADGVSYTDLETYDALGEKQSESFDNLGENVRYIKWIFTEKESGNVALGNINLAAYVAPGVATTTVIDDSGITNTDFYTSTAAGSLSATVTPDGGAALSTPTITWSGDNNAVATINATTGAVTLVGEGTVTFTATYAGVPGEYDASSDTYELTVTDSNPYAPGTEANPYTVAQVEGQASATTFGNDIYVTGYIVGSVTSNKCYKKTLVNTNLLLADTPDVSFEEGAAVASNTDGLIPVELPSTPSSIRENWGVASNNVIGYKVILKGNAQAYFGTNAIKGTSEISAVSVPAKFNDNGYATYASKYPLDFSDDSEFSAWQITDANSSTGVITFSQITDAVAAGTGVLLKGTGSTTINIPVAASGDDISGTNKLVGFTSATDVTAGQYYGLKGNEFVPVNAGTVPAGKALLDASKVGEVKAFTFVFEDATGIESIQNSKSEIQNAIYDLSGRRVVKPTKGLYIVNGKKIVK